MLCYACRFNVESKPVDVIRRSLSCSAVLLTSRRTHREPKNWLTYNDVVYPPSLPDEPLRPAVSEAHCQSTASYVECVACSCCD